jgi:glycine/D-amino acid oxidase-like deaminating enzyme
VSALGHPEARSVWEAGRRNRELLKELLEELGRDCGLQARGSFLLATDREEAESLAQSEDMLRDDGFPGEFLDHYMLETHFDVSGFTGAYWEADDLELDAAELRATVVAAARSADAVFRTARVLVLDAGEPGVVVTTDEGPVRASRVVVVADNVASEVLPDLRPRLLTVASARLHVAAVAGASLPGVARTADGRIAWQASASGLTLAATGGSPPGSEAEDFARLDALASRLAATPGSERRWADSAGRVADGLPIVGRLAGQPLAVACGLGTHEASLAFVAARWVAEAVLTGSDPTPGPFRVSRA